MPEISVIVPVYNIEKYLRQCIESIITQTYTDIEVVLIDDGSTDTSGKICDEYAQKDSRVKVFHIENSGPSIARNYGIENSAGAYFMFVDSDDWIDARTLEICSKEAVKENCDIVLINMCDFKNETVQEHRLFRDYRKCFEGEKIREIEDIFLSGRVENPVSTVSLTGPVCKLYKRETVAGCYFPGNITSGEDACFVVQVLKKSHKLVYLNQVLYHRRVLKNSLSHLCDADYGKRRVLYVNWMIDFWGKEKSFELLNLFCFNNYCLVANKILHSNVKGIKRKKELIKEFLEKIEFEYDFQKVDIKSENRTIKLINKLLRKKQVMLVDLIYKVSYIRCAKL